MRRCVRYGTESTGRAVTRWACALFIACAVSPSIGYAQHGASRADLSETHLVIDLECVERAGQRVKHCVSVRRGHTLIVGSILDDVITWLLDHTRPPQPADGHD